MMAGIARYNRVQRVTIISLSILNASICSVSPLSHGYIYDQPTPPICRFIALCQSDAMMKSTVSVHSQSFSQIWSITDLAAAPVAVSQIAQ